MFTKKMFKKNGLIEELASYLKNNLKKGYTKDSLRWALVNQGYSRIEIEKAIKMADLELAEEAPMLKTKIEATYKYEFADESKELNLNEKKSFWKKILG